MNFRHLVERKNISSETARQYIVPNPSYQIAARLKKETRFLKKYEKLNTEELYPFGALYLDGYDQKLPLFKAETSIALRPLQRAPFESLKHEKGALLYAKTGSGKTVMTAALYDVWRGNMLIVVHSLDNVRYFQKTFKGFIDIDAGMVCSGSNTIKKVTITTFNTFRAKHREFATHKHEDGTTGFDHLMIDEADAFFTKKARDAVNSFPAIRKFAFTGTKKTEYDEYRSQGSLETLPLFYGRIVEAEDDKSKDPLEDVFYRTFSNNYFEIVENERVYIMPFQWHEFRKRLDEDVDRKRAQWDYVMANTNQSEHTLVLFDRVADVEAFYQKAQKLGINSFMNHGSLPKKDREKMLEYFYAEGGYCFAQYKTMGRGYDNDKLSKCFVLFPTRGENNIRQIVGRVVRWLEGKRSFVYLWNDSALHRQHKAHIKVFEEFFDKRPIKI